MSGSLPLLVQQLAACVLRRRVRNVRQAAPTYWLTRKQIGQRYRSVKTSLQLLLGQSLGRDSEQMTVSMDLLHIRAMVTSLGNATSISSQLTRSFERSTPSGFGVGLKHCLQTLKEMVCAAAFLFSLAHGISTLQ